MANLIDEEPQPRRAVPFHPFLLALWPIFFLYTKNLDEMHSLGPVLNWALIVLIPAALLMALLYRALGDVHKAALAVALTAAAFYCYPLLARLLELVPRSRRSAMEPGLICLIGVGLILVVVLMRRSSRRFVPATRILNVVAVVAILQAAVPLVVSLFTAREDVAETATGIGASMSGSRAPDVYYIILDGYARDDVLADYYGFDNSGFLRELESRGFFVARESTSNYSQTRLSIPSSLNMLYLNELDSAVSQLRLKGRRQRKKNRRKLNHWFKESRVFREFKDLGYRFHLITSRFQGTSSTPSADVVHSCSAVSEFGVILIQTSMLKVFRKPLVRRRVQSQVLCQYEALETVAETDGPKFVFTHIVSPHAPWLFDSEGGPVDVEQDLTMGAEVSGADRYVAQVRFNNTKLLSMIDAILAVPGQDPIVILQGDHGPSYAGDGKQRRQLKKRIRKVRDVRARRMVSPGGVYARIVRERMGIFNAYRFPDGGSERLYPSITPVNSFRLVFDIYFGSSLGLERDRALFSLYAQPFHVWDVTNSVRQLSGFRRVGIRGRSAGDQPAPVKPRIK